VKKDKLFLVPQKYFPSMETIVLHKYVMGSSVAYSGACSIFLPNHFSLYPTSAVSLCSFCSLIDFPFHGVRASLGDLKLVLGIGERSVLKNFLCSSPDKKTSLFFPFTI
jgi:hypothetical protein